MANKSIFSCDYRSPPSGDGVITTSDGRTILLTSEGNAMGHPDFFTEIHHFHADIAEGCPDTFKLWTSWLRFIFQMYDVVKVYDSEINYEGDADHIIGADGYIEPEQWIGQISQNFGLNQ